MLLERRGAPSTHSSSHTRLMGYAASCSSRLTMLGAAPGPGSGLVIDLPSVSDLYDEYDVALDGKYDAKVTDAKAASAFEAVLKWLAEGDGVGPKLAFDCATDSIPF